MGEPAAGRDEALGGNVRTLNLTGGNAQRTIDRTMKIWPGPQENKPRLASSSAAASSSRAGSNESPPATSPTKP